MNLETDLEIKNLKFKLDLKSIDDKGFFEGYGSTFDGMPDLGGDVIRPGAFIETIAERGIFGNGIKMLWQHDSKDPLGVWHDLHEDKKGLFCRGQLMMDSDLGKHRYGLLKMGALDGLSIGYSAKDFEIVETDTARIRYIKKAGLYEISPVTFQMNLGASITDVKSAIENCRNERELEHALREAGMSKSAAIYITGLIKGSLRRGKDNILNEVLTTLKKTNIEMEVHRLLSAEEIKGAIPYQKQPIASAGMAWDGPAQVRAASTGDLVKICAWYDSANKETKSAYKLPHHLVEGYKTVWKGVAAAMGALLGSMGGVKIPSGDRKAVYNHLKSHYGDFSKPAPDFKEYSESELNELLKKGIIYGE